MHGVFYMWKKEDQPVRLKKKISKKEKVQKWLRKHKMPFIVAGVIATLIVFVALVIIFAPGTESGSWYNGLKGVI